MASFKDKIITITGGASGMGLATGRILASKGAKAICIGDFNDTNFESVTKELRSINSQTEVFTTKVDVSDDKSVDKWIDSVVAKFGGLDYAVNAAGVPQRVGARGSPALLEETNETWHRTMGVNLNGVFYCSRAVVKAMVGLEKKPRAIVNIASLAALVHGPDCYAYGASKAAVVYFTSSFAKDVLPHGIRANTVSPGATNTPMLTQFFTAPKEGEPPMDTGAFQIVDASDIARTVVYLLSEESAHIAGVNIPVGPGAP